MVDITDGNIYVTTGTVSENTISSGTTVKIHATKIDYNYDNPVSVIPIPVSKGNTNALKDLKEDPFPRVIDLKLVKESVTVQGMLDDEASESANTKRNNLLDMGKRERGLTLVWGRGNYQTIWRPESNPKKGTGVFLTKIGFTETVGIFGDVVSGDAQPERNIAIIIVFTRGKDL